MEASAWAIEAIEQVLIEGEKACVVFCFCLAALLAIKLSETPFTNDLRQFQEIASGAPLAMVAVAID